MIREVISKLYTPTPALKDYVKYYIVFETSENDFNNLTQCTIPYCSPVLILSVSDTAPTFIYENHIVPRVTAHISGQTFSPVYLEKPGNYKIIVVLFQTIGAYQLFRIPQKDYLNQFIELNQILGNMCNFFTEKLYQIRTDNHLIISEIEKFLFSFLKNPKIEKNYFDLALSMIKAKEGNIRIEKLYKFFNVNPRTMRRDFNIKVGISPKEFSRFYRLTQLHKYLMFGRNINMHDLVYHLGYHDQSHLIRDFRNYARYAPSSLQKNILLNHFLKADNYYEKFDRTII